VVASLPVAVPSAAVVPNGVSEIKPG